MKQCKQCQTCFKKHRTDQINCDNCIEANRRKHKIKPIESNKPALSILDISVLAEKSNMSYGRYMLMKGL